MKRVIINAITAFLFMLVQTNFDAAFGIQAMVQFGVIASVLSGMTQMSMASSALSILILALLCDVFVSGPVGLYAFVLMCVFALCRAIVARLRSERIISVMIFCFVFTALFECLLAAVYCAYYKNSVFLSIFVRCSWENCLLTSLFSPLVMWLNHALESIITSRKKTGLA